MASADYSVGTKVTADVSNFEKGMNKAEKSLKGFSDKLANSIDRLGKKGLVGSVANVTLAMQGLTKSFNTVIKFAKDVGKAINECTEAYKGQLIAERALDTAIQNNPFISGASSKALKQFASDMQRVTNYGDEELIPMMTNLVSLGRTESEVMQIMSVAMDMSAGMGISLDSAITQLNATLNGNIGRLGQQNAELKGLTEEELKQGKAIEILGEKFKGLSSATADTSKQLQNIKGDFKEALGQFTLPSSDMWNKFWAGFYEQGIKVLEGINKKINELTIGKTLAGAMTGQLGKLSYTGDRIEYLRDAFAMISDEELDAVTDYLGSLSRVNDEQKQILERAELEKQRRIDIQKIERQMAEESAKRKKEKEEEAELENGIALLKDKHIQKLKEQEAKWENIKKVTGQEVALEEKLKFYQDDLVAIMTEAGGQITTNNQYYKDQKKIIDELIKLIKEEGGVVVETEKDIVEATERELTQTEKFFESLKERAENWQEIYSALYDRMSNSFSNFFNTLGESLIEGGKAWEDYGKEAIKNIVDIITALGKQLTVMAVAKTLSYDYAGAIKAVAGATLAFTASGTLNAVANKMGNVNETLKDFNSSSTITIEKVRALRQELNALLSGLQYTPASSFAEMSAMEANQKRLAEAYASLVKQRQNVWNSMAQKDKEFFQDFGSSLHYGVYQQLHDLDAEISSTANDLSKVINQIKAYYNTIIGNLETQIISLDNVIASYKVLYDSVSKVSLGLEEYQKQFNIVIKEQLVGIKKLVSEVYTTLTTSGKQIGANLVTSIIEGATKEDFLKQMRNYIRENLIKLTVYTESFQERLAKVGSKLTSALLLGGDISVIRNDLELLWEEASANALKVEGIITDVFGDLDNEIEEITDDITETVDIVEEKFSTFEESMLTFKETIADLGGSVADNFVDAISEGLNQSDFLDNMKQWIKRMLVQSVVYTESMKAEIEAIGQAITKGIREGFTETSLHEIRRDLSWVFNEANETVSSLDDILNKTFGGYAIGTNNALSGLHLVGEAGPELVRFRGGEQVLNTVNTQKALEGMGGTTINQNVTFNNLQDTTAYAMMNQFKQYNRQMAINGVI